MDKIAPLLQTLLWVGLIAGIVWRFDKPIYALLVALQKRVEAGSTIKAGPFEIGQELRPQEPIKQKSKVESEIRELIEGDAEAGISKPDVPQTNIQARYFQAEDMALRAVQSEFGASINRQVTGGFDIGFDGAFVIKGQLHIVEVKYSYHSISINNILKSIDKLITSLEGYNWKNVRIIVALVSENEIQEEKIASITSKITEKYTLPIEIRCYKLSELENKFGVTGKQNG